MTINQNLRTLRQLSGMTQEEVANHVGLTRQAISGYESGRTHPDLDMLAKLAALYQTDISGILYGRSREQKQLRALRIAAVAAFSAVLLLVLLHSCLIFVANRFLPVSTGAAAIEARPLLGMRFAILSVRDRVQGLTGAVSLVGCLTLGVLLTGLRRRPPIGKAALFLLAFVAGTGLCTAPFGLSDPVYQLVDYLLIAVNPLFHLLLLLAYWATLALVKRRRAAAKG